MVDSYDRIAVRLHFHADLCMQCAASRKADVTELACEIGRGILDELWVARKTHDIGDSDGFDEAMKVMKNGL